MEARVTVKWYWCHFIDGACGWALKHRSVLPHNSLSSDNTHKKEAGIGWSQHSFHPAVHWKSFIWHQIRASWIRRAHNDDVLSTWNSSYKQRWSTRCLNQSIEQYVIYILGPFATLVPVLPVGKVLIPTASNPVLLRPIQIHAGLNAL